MRLVCRFAFGSKGVKVQRVGLCVHGVQETGDPLTLAPHLGEHTREILGKMGYGTGDIERLAASGVVVCYRGTANSSLTLIALPSCTCYT